MRYVIAARYSRLCSFKYLIGPLLTTIFLWLSLRHTNLTALERVKKVFWPRFDEP
jgi:hypothetical protein